MDPMRLLAIVAVGLWVLALAAMLAQAWLPALGFALIAVSPTLPFTPWGRSVRERRRAGSGGPGSG